MPLRVYYSPTKSNERVAEAINNPRFRFIQLNESPEHRKEQLMAIKGEAAFIWGDGEHHEESYYFTKRHVDLKVNADQHTDTYPHSPKYDRMVGFWNHMDHTRSEGVCIITQVGSMKSVEHTVAELRKLSRLEGFRVAITIDGDGITSFPARPSWVNRSGIDISALPTLIEAAGPGLTRLDIGGLVESIPDFSFRRDATKPSFDDALKFSDIALGFGMGKPTNGDQRLLDSVASYAALVYEKALRAFADLLGIH